MKPLTFKSTGRSSQALYSISTVNLHRGCLILVCLSLIAVAHPINADAQTPQQIAKKAFSSVVLLVMEDANGQPMSLGSGFFVREGVIASNIHVVKGAARGYARLVGEKTKFDIKGTVGVDPQRDLVLLKIPAQDATSLTLGNSDLVEVGEPVYAVGNPHGLEGTFSQGIVSSVREVGSNRLLQITAPISPGSSGGPVLNQKGQVIGVAVATFSGGQNLNFAIPSNYLKKLTDSLEPLSPLSKIDDSKQERSILADFGGRSIEGVIGYQLRWDRPISFGVVTISHGQYTFSLKNQLRVAVRDVYCLVVFYDKNESPIDVDVVEYRGIIPPGLAKRLSGRVHSSVQSMTTPEFLDSPTRRIEFRILDYRLAE